MDRATDIVEVGAFNASIPRGRVRARQAGSMSCLSEEQIIEFLETVDRGEVSGPSTLARHPQVHGLVRSEFDGGPSGEERSLNRLGVHRLGRHRADL